MSSCLNVLAPDLPTEVPSSSFSPLGSLDLRRGQHHTSSTISWESNGVPEYSLGDGLRDETSMCQDPHIIVVYILGSPWDLGRRARISKQEFQIGYDQDSPPQPCAETDMTVSFVTHGALKCLLSRRKLTTGSLGCVASKMPAT